MLDWHYADCSQIYLQFSHISNFNIYSASSSTRSHPSITMGHMSAGLGLFLIVIFFVIVAIVGWVAYTQLQARRLGLPPPTLASYNPFKSNNSSHTYGGQSAAPSGVMGWVNDKFKSFKNRNNRTAGGAFEEPSGGGRSRAANRGFGPLDPDDAWDARVGNEADAYGPGGYYEEQELGLHPEHGREGGVAPSGWGEGSRGRSQSREPSPYQGASSMEAGTRPSANPFDDSAAEHHTTSMRGLSPRPAEGHNRSNSHDPDSPTERRSMFHENV